MEYYLNPEFLLNFRNADSAYLKTKKFYRWLLIGNYHDANGNVIKTEFPTTKTINDESTVGAYTEAKEFPFNFVAKNEETGEGCYIAIDKYISNNIIVESNQNCGIKLDETYAALVCYEENPTSLFNFSPEDVIFIHKNTYNNSLLNKKTYLNLRIGNTKVNLNKLEN